MHSNNLLRTSAAAGLALLLCSFAAGQTGPTATPAPNHVLAAFDITSGTIQDLVLPNTTGQSFQVIVDLGGSARKLVLDPHDVRAPDFKLIVDDQNGLHQIPTPPSVTYRGMVEGFPESAVAATLVDRQLTAVVSLVHGDMLWGIQPRREVEPSAPITQHVVYSSRSGVHLDVHCGTPDPGPGETPGLGEERHPQGGQAGLDVLKLAEIGCDADRDFYVLNGSNTTATQNDVTAVINSMNVIYKRDVEIEHRITQTIVRTTTTYTTTNPGGLLNQFASRWNSLHGNVQRDLAHLFTGKQLIGSTIGIAALGTVCNLSSAYGLSESRFTTNMLFRTGLTAHEVGHNWSAGHCSGSGCNIMCAGLGGCSGIVSSFSTVSINAIVAFKNSRSCLTNAVPPPNLFNITPNSVQAFKGGGMTLNGTNLDAVTEIWLSTGANIFKFGPTTKSATQLTFLAIPPPEIGVALVRVVSPGGTSNPVVLTVTPNVPTLIDGPSLSLRGFPFAFSVHSDIGRKVLLFGALQNTPSVLPGIVNFQIGNGFQFLLQLAPELTSDRTGTAAGSITFPTTMPSIQIYMQALTYDPANLTLPLDTTSNYLTVPIL